MLVGVCAFDADAVTAWLVGRVGVVDADIDSVTGGGVDETIALGGVAIDVVYVAVRWIGVLVGLVWM